MQRFFSAAPKDWADCNYPCHFGPIGRTAEALERRGLIEFRLSPVGAGSRKWQWRRVPDAASQAAEERKS
jgi:hypothetical protein